MQKTAMHNYTSSSSSSKMEVNCSGEMARARASLNNDNNNNDNNNNNNNNSRWNPTKEQINMLENLYREGLRTPSAEQIQQITSRLKAYGHIEGKNVFYWFQNHKARQRQKQKQESFAYLNRYIHHSAVAAAQCPAVVYHPLQPNGFYGPYFIPQGEAPMGLYPQYPKVPVPGPYKRKLRRDRVIEKARVTSFTAPAHDHHQINQYSTFSCNSCNINGHETLDLFPLHPTGILDDQVRAVPSDGENSSASESSVAGFHQRPFIDFFH